MPLQTDDSVGPAPTGVLECDSLSLLFQGAEARVYRSTFLGKSCAVKERFYKKYRAPALDSELARSRLLQEARALVRCRRAGVDCPVVYFVDIPRRRLFLELVHHLSLRDFLNLVDLLTIPKSLPDNDKASRPLQPNSSVLLGTTAAAAEHPVPSNSLSQCSMPIKEAVESLVPEWLQNPAFALLDKLYLTPGCVESFIESIPVEIGKAIAKLHNNGIIHGDITTSNIIIRPSGSLGCSSNDSAREESTVGATPNLESPLLSVVFIDFGLSSTSQSSEAKAVELYVMERAILSTHPNWKNLMNDILVQGYYPFVANPTAIKHSLKEVRLRGRKRLAIG